VNLDGWLPVLIVFSSFFTGVVVFFLPEESHRLRTALNLLGAVSKVVLVGALIWGVYHERVYEARLTLLPGFDLAIGADAMSVLFVTLSTILWLVTTVYAVGYLEDSPDRSRFFGVFSLCVSATTGIALAANLVTFLVFYECLTLTTYPLVVHRGTEKSLQAGRVYLAYTLGGGMVFLLGTVWLNLTVGPVEFREGGVLAAHGATHGPELKLLFAVLIGGLGVKAALVPLHGWLPEAMIAPAPVSALLHAVAVVKAGAFGIVRVVYDVFGVEFAEELGVLDPLSAVAAVTILYGSLQALFQDDLKRRLAYSTVSQVSYIVLGASIFGPLATLGGIVHLVHQGVMKITLFFCAGNYAETLGVHRVSELSGVGRRMPWTTAAFTVGALGMIGVPPLAGFFSKWFLGLGALEAGEGELILVLLGSSLLNAAYFLPILHTAWFEKQKAPWPAEGRPDGRLETDWMLLVPPLLTAALVVVFGLLANTPFSPIGWSSLIVEREYGP
jgi:multicomponent Na+:H+ antiporter subunit D